MRNTGLPTINLGYNRLHARHHAHLSPHCRKDLVMQQQQQSEKQFSDCIRQRARSLPKDYALNLSTLMHLIVCLFSMNSRSEHCTDELTGVENRMSEPCSIGFRLHTIFALLRIFFNSKHLCIRSRDSMLLNLSGICNFCCCFFLKDERQRTWRLFDVSS